VCVSVCVWGGGGGNLQAQDVGVVADQLCQQVLPPVAPVQHPSLTVENVALHPQSLWVQTICDKNGITQAGEGETSS